MFVQMLQTLASAEQCYVAGQVYEPTDAVATSFIRARVARKTTQPPEVIGQLLSRLDYGAGKKCLFLPFIGEFGHLVLTHLRIVHFHKAAHKIVCCRPGQQVLYPSADEFITDWADPVIDIHRIGTMRGRRYEWPEITVPGAVRIEAGNLTPTQELHCIRQGERIPFRPVNRGLWPDVVLGVRRRDFTPERNWAHWPTVADALTKNGYTFAVMGDRATSFDLRGQRYHTGDYDTDAAIESLMKCALYIGTDSGGSHLAATVGAPMLIFRTDAGYSRDLTPQMKQRNDRVRLIDGCWHNPSAVIAAALEELKCAQAN